MRGSAATGVLSGTLLLIGGGILQHGTAAADPMSKSHISSPAQPIDLPVHSPDPTTYSSDLSAADLTDVVVQYCQVCHNDALQTGNLSLSGYNVETASSAPEISERMILKLRAAMMPPPGMPRPGGDTLDVLVATLEENMDEAAADAPNPGGRTFQRLNRAEYERSVAALLDLEISAGDYLPLDTKSANFDNIADVQLLSPTLLSAYLEGASEVARLAVGNTLAGNQETTYRIPRLASQRERAQGAPYGSRGGTSVIHNFPADGSYAFSVSFHYSPEGILFGRNEPGEQVDVSIDGEQVAVLPIDRFMAEADPGAGRA